MKAFKIFAINPGSTSTKVALFQHDELVFSHKVNHAHSELARFPHINDQLSYRKSLILEELKRSAISLADIDAFVGRGGAIQTLQGGTYGINDLMLEHARIGLVAQHPANLGAQLAHEFAHQYGGAAYVVNPPTTDEFQEVARITGFADIYRESRLHALNQKEVAMRFAASQNKRYPELNLVVVHIGGGLSVTAHRRGRMVDSNDIINGDGPMAPTRSGALPAVALMNLCFSGKYTQQELYDRITRSGGFVDHLGTSDAREVEGRRESGDAHAKLIYDAMLYQTCKQIGAYATVLKGDVDAIIITGGLANDSYVIDYIRDMAGYLAPVAVMAGEFEMEALALGALRILNGTEQLREYTGTPVWSGFNFAV